MISILQTWKMWLTNVKQTAKGHKASEGRAAIKTKMFKCELQTVIASTDIEKKKGNQGNSVFPRTQDLSFTYVKPSNPSNNL